MIVVHLLAVSECKLNFKQVETNDYSKNHYQNNKGQKLAWFYSCFIVMTKCSETINTGESLGEGCVHVCVNMEGWAEGQKMIVISELDVRLWHLAHVLGQVHPADSLGVAPHTPTYFNCSPKACWVSGKLKNWSVVKDMHAESGEEEANRFLEKWAQYTFDPTSSLNLKSQVSLPWASKNSSSELSSESRAMLCILHSEMLWRDGLTGKKKKKKKSTWAKKPTVILGHVFQPLSFPF